MNASEACMFRSAPLPNGVFTIVYSYHMCVRFVLYVCDSIDLPAALVFVQSLVNVCNPGRLSKLPDHDVVLRADVSCVKQRYLLSISK